MCEGSDHIIIESDIDTATLIKDVREREREGNEWRVTIERLWRDQFGDVGLYVKPPKQRKAKKEPSQKPTPDGSLTTAPPSTGTKRKAEDDADDESRKRFEDGLGLTKPAAAANEVTPVKTNERFDLESLLAVWHDFNQDVSPEQLSKVADVIQLHYGTAELPPVKLLDDIRETVRFPTQTRAELTYRNMYVDPRFVGWKDDQVKTPKPAIAVVTPISNSFMRLIQAQRRRKAVVEAMMDIRRRI